MKSRMFTRAANLAVLISLIFGQSPAELSETVPATTETVPAAAQEETRIDLLEVPLPAVERDAALEVLTCDIDTEGLCDELTELMLELPFAWHRAGYTIDLLDGAYAPERDGYRVNGVARRSAKEIVLYIHWGDTVKSVPGAFRAVKRTLAHELGHAMHQSCDERAVLAAWREVRDIPADVPDHGHGHEGSMFYSVAEDFADTAMAWLTDGEFKVRSPIEEARFVPAYPGQTMSATDVDPALAAEFFHVCSTEG